jgi:hypothetical protein
VKPCVRAVLLRAFGFDTIVLDDDTPRDDFGRVILHIRLMKRMSDVSTGGLEIREVRHHHEVEVVVEVTGVVAAHHREQFGYRAKFLERVAKGLLCFGQSSFSPLRHNDLAEHRFTFR